MSTPEEQIELPFLSRRTEINHSDQSGHPIESSSEQPISIPATPIADEEQDEDATASGEMPLGDPKDIRIRDYRLGVAYLADRLRDQSIELQPDFQRKGGLWSTANRSRLIESMLLRIPIPSFYVDSSTAKGEDHWIVVDGLQRLTTIKEFVVDQSLELCALEYLKDLEGKRFSQLPGELQHRILRTQLTIYCIEYGTPEPVKFNVFRRINTGGMPLSAQEIRNALYRGPGLDLLKHLAKTPLFERRVGKSGDKDRMTGHEYVLRFLALCTGGTQGANRRSLDDFLNEQLKGLNAAAPGRLEELSQRFQRALVASDEILGEFAFRKVYSKQGPRSPVNKALFEAWMFNLDRCSSEELNSLIYRKESVLDRFIDLMQDPEFEKSVSMATRDLSKIKHRVEAIRTLIQEVLHAPEPDSETRESIS